MSCKATGVFNLRIADVLDSRRSGTPFLSSKFVIIPVTLVEKFLQSLS